MKVRPRRLAGGATQADDLTCLHKLAQLYEGTMFLKMRVGGPSPVAMEYIDIICVAGKCRARSSPVGIVPHRHDPAFSGGAKFGAQRHVKIKGSDPLMGGGAKVTLPHSMLLTVFPRQDVLRAFVMPGRRIAKSFLKTHAVR